MRAPLSLLLVLLACACTNRASSRSEQPVAAESALRRPETPEDSLRHAVARLIDRAVQADSQRQSFAALEALGCRAVPALIRRLDDRRRLPSRSLSFANASPGAFEGLRHYSPELMVDALAGLLNQITGRDFGAIYNGASEAERARTVQGWRDYLQRVGPAGVCRTGGASR